MIVRKIWIKEDPVKKPKRRLFSQNCYRIFQAIHMAMRCPYPIEVRIEDFAGLFRKLGFIQAGRQDFRQTIIGQNFIREMPNVAQQRSTSL